MEIRIELIVGVISCVYIISTWIKKRESNILDKTNNLALCPSQDKKIKETKEFIEKHNQYSYDSCGCGGYTSYNRGSDISYSDDGTIRIKNFGELNGKVLHSEVIKKVRAKLGERYYVEAIYDTHIVVRDLYEGEFINFTAEIKVDKDDEEKKEFIIKHNQYSYDSYGYGVYIN